MNRRSLLGALGAMPFARLLRTDPAPEIEPRPAVALQCPEDAQTFQLVTTVTGAAADQSLTFEVWTTDGLGRSSKAATREAPASRRPRRW